MDKNRHSIYYFTKMFQDYGIVYCFNSDEYNIFCKRENSVPKRVEEECGNVLELQKMI